MQRMFWTHTWINNASVAFRAARPCSVANHLVMESELKQAARRRSAYQLMNLCAKQLALCHLLAALHGGATKPIQQYLQTEGPHRSASNTRRKRHPIHRPTQLSALRQVCHWLAVLASSRQLQSHQHLLDQTRGHTGDGRKLKSNVGTLCQFCQVHFAMALQLISLSLSLCPSPCCAVESPVNFGAGYPHSYMYYIRSLRSLESMPRACLRSTATCGHAACSCS